MSNITLFQLKLNRNSKTNNNKNRAKQSNLGNIFLTNLYQNCSFRFEQSLGNVSVLYRSVKVY